MQNMKKVQETQKGIQYVQKGNIKRASQDGKKKPGDEKRVSTTKRVQKKQKQKTQK